MDSRAATMRTALIIVDMMNTLDFPEGAVLARRAAPVARRIARLRHRFYARKMPVVYANDNFGEWHMDFRELVDRCAQGPGRGLVEVLRPGDTDYYVLKPRHSAFFDTPLPMLLAQLRVARVVLCGIATDVCILASAIDGYMRGYSVVVPADCVQAETASRNASALKVMRDSFSVTTLESRHLRL